MKNKKILFLCASAMLVTSCANNPFQSYLKSYSKESTKETLLTNADQKLENNFAKGVIRWCNNLPQTESFTLDIKTNSFTVSKTEYEDKKTVETNSYTYTETHVEYSKERNIYTYKSKTISNGSGPSSNSSSESNTEYQYIFNGKSFVCVNVINKSYFEYSYLSEADCEAYKFSNIIGPQLLAIGSGLDSIKYMIEYYSLSSDCKFYSDGSVDTISATTSSTTPISREEKETMQYDVHDNYVSLCQEEISDQNSENSSYTDKNYTSTKSSSIREIKSGSTTSAINYSGFSVRHTK